MKDDKLIWTPSKHHLESVSQNGSFGNCLNVEMFDLALIKRVWEESIEKIFFHITSVV